MFLEEALIQGSGAIRRSVMKVGHLPTTWEAPASITSNIHRPTPARAHTCIHLHAQKQVHTCTRTHRSIPARTQVYTCTHTCTHLHAQKQVHTCMCTQVHTCMHINRYTHAHRYTPASMYAFNSKEKGQERCLVISKRKAAHSKHLKQTLHF